MKIDLHVHSKFSTRPSLWVLQKLGCQECYTEPQALYRIAKRRGMSAVTITDHNTINGCLDIASLPGTFISEEVTTYFPEERCKVHVLVYDIDEAQHQEIQKVRESIFDLVNYLQTKGLTHSLAHPVWSVNDRLTLAHFEQLILLFKNFEMNGGRDGQLNDWLRAMLAQLTPKDLERLADKYQLAPAFHNPWEKNFTGGSDDHSSLNIARMFTQVEGAFDVKHFLHGVNRGKAQARGQASTPLTLAYNIYSIAYQFYKKKYNLDQYASSNIFVNFFERALQVNLEPQNSVPKFRYYRQKIKNFFKSPARSTTILSLIKDEASKISYSQVHEKPGVQWFQIASDISHNILKQFHKHFRKALGRANFIELFNSITSTGMIYLGLTPYFAAFSSFAKDRSLGMQIMRNFLEKEPGEANEFNAIRLAHFTDTFYEINGVGLTLRRQVEAAVQADKNYTVITCDNTSRPPQKGIQNFIPVGVFHLPEYPEQKLFHPPFLEILKYFYEQNFTHLQAATPGPMGLTALALARILQLPIWGTYHTALPQYAQYLTEDNAIVQSMWKYIIWFYNQMDVVFVPSRSTGEELQRKGIDPGKLHVFPRGVDTDLFHPAKRNGVLENRYQVEEGLKLLYVGRVSKEKNLELLGRVYQALLPAHPGLRLIVVGDGPYLEEMRRELADTPCVFTGYLEGEDLAAVYASCDLFLFPSTTDTFGNVVLEAQASGIPVIVTDAGGPRENVVPGETGLIVPSDDEESLLTAIESLVAEPARLKRMGQAARRYVQQRSFDNAFQAIWQIYEERAAVNLQL